MGDDINIRNAKALASAVKAANIEIGKNSEQLANLERTVNQLQVTLDTLKSEVQILKVSQMGSGPTA